MRRRLIVPAAGMGTRLTSPLPKALTPVSGRPMIAHVLERFRPHCADAVVVIHPSAREAFETWLPSAPLPVVLIEQAHPTGMMDAILLARPALVAVPADRVWICWCDQLLLRAKTLERLASREEALPEIEAVFPTARLPQPYIHFDRASTGQLSGVRQRREGDEMPDVGEGDAGLFALSMRAYRDSLPEYAKRAEPGRATGERNFLPFLPWLAGRSAVATIDVTDATETQGVNTPAELAFVESQLRDRDLTSSL